MVEISPLILLVIGFIGLFITFFLVLTGKKTKKDILSKNDFDKFFITDKKISIFMLVYLFIYFMMIIVSIVSNFYEIIIFGGIPALIPPMILIIIRKLEFKNNSKR